MQNKSHTIIPDWSNSRLPITAIGTVDEEVLLLGGKEKRGRCVQRQQKKKKNRSVQMSVENLNVVSMNTKGRELAATW